LRQEPLIATAFRFRRSARLGPLRFNFAKGGLSSISDGGRGASFNIPVSLSGKWQRRAAQHCGAAGHGAELKGGAHV